MTVLPVGWADDMIGSIRDGRLTHTIGWRMRVWDLASDVHLRKITV